MIMTMYCTHIKTGTSIGFDVTEQNVTEGTNSTVEVCFSLQQGSSSASLVVNISATAASTGKF